MWGKCMEIGITQSLLRGKPNERITLLGLTYVAPHFALPNHLPLAKISWHFANSITKTKPITYMLAQNQSKCVKIV